MMWLVRLALRRPISVAVMALLMMVLGALSFELMNVDIFPAINLPVVLEVWNYPGLSAFQIERRMVWISERAASTTVNGIEHIDSSSMNGLGILKIYFYPGSDIGAAIAQINCGFRNDPFPIAARHRSAAGHLIQRGQRSGRPAQHFQRHAFRTAALRLRTQLHSDSAFHDSWLFQPRAARRRAARSNGEPESGTLYANGMSPADVGNALAQANVVIPSGTAKMGNYEYDVDLNMSPNTVAEFNRSADQVSSTARRFILGDVAPVSRYSSAADQRGARRWPSGDLPDGHQARRGFDADGGRRGQSKRFRGFSAAAPQGAASIARLRSIDLRRARYGKWCARRSSRRFWSR